MTSFIRLWVLTCILFISQIGFAQSAARYEYDWSRDGSLLIVVEYGVSVTVYNANGQLLASQQGDFHDASLSPDENRLLMSLGEMTEIRDANTLQLLGVLPITRVGWSSDGSELVSYDPNPLGGMKFYSAEDGTLLRDFTGADSAFAHWPTPPSQSPDATYFVAGFRDQLVVLDAVTGAQVYSYQLDSDIAAYSWSTDSTRIALSLRKELPTAVEGSYPTGNSRGTYRLNSIVAMEIATGSITDLRSGFEYPVVSMVWSPDDTQIATWFDGNVNILDSANGDVLDSFSITPNYDFIGYSPWGGRITMGLYRSQSDVPPVLDDLIQIIVPLTTLDRFAEIATSCGAPGTLTDFDTSLTDPAAIAAQAQTLLAQLDALPEGTIPSGCAADLSAIAEAIIAETPRERRE